MERGSGPEAALVGRDDELAAVHASLTAGGCVIAGPAGVGKSRLADEAAGAEGHTVIRVLATASAAAVPFGAFGHLLPPTTGNAAPAIPEFIDTLRAAHGTRRPTVLVDDAHLLDQPSAALVLALATSRVANVIATVRSHEPEPDAITALWKDTGLERIELLSLGRADVRTLVHALLGSKVHSSVVDRVHDLTLGNPLYIHELIRDARRTGAVHQLDQRWHWREELLEFNRLRVLIAHRLERVSPDARRVLELIGIGAPVPLRVVEQLAPADAVDELDRLGLVSLTTSTPPTVAMGHPLYGEVVAAGLSRLTATRLRRQLAAALGTGDDGDRLRVATWLMEAGEADAALFVDASAIALRRGDPHLALQLAEASPLDLRSALATASALIALGRHDDVEPVLASYETAAAAAEERLSTLYLETRGRGLLRGGSDENEHGELLTRASTWHASRTWAAVVAAQQAWMLVYARQLAEGFERARDLLTVADLPPLVRLGMLAISGNAQSRSGLIDDCVATAHEIGEMARAFDAPWEARWAVLFFDVVPRIMAGRDLDAAEGRIIETRAEATARGDRPLFTATTFALGLAAMRRGHAMQAVARLSQAADDLAIADPADNQLLVLVLLSSAYALAGDVGEARATLEQVETMSGRRPRSAERLGASSPSPGPPSMRSLDACPSRSSSCSRSWARVPVISRRRSRPCTTPCASAATHAPCWNRCGRGWSTARMASSISSSPTSGRSVTTMPSARSSARADSPPWDSISTPLRRRRWPRPHSSGRAGQRRRARPRPLRPSMPTRAEGSSRQRYGGHRRRPR